MHAEEDEIASLRNQRLRERIQQMQDAQAKDEQKRTALKFICTAEAFQRLSNVRLASPELFEKVSSVLIYLAQTKQISGKVSEDQVKRLLAKLTEKPESKIQVKRKNMGED